MIFGFGLDSCIVFSFHRAFYSFSSGALVLHQLLSLGYGIGLSEYLCGNE